jgi:predicted AAA+ superfamily ATPase
MKRKLYDDLKKWHTSKNRKPLILEGARQVGKTWLLKEFGEQEFDSVAYIDFHNPEYSGVKDLFAETISPERILSYLESFFAMDIIAGKTLIIFDEVQEAPEALASLKYFYEKTPEHSVIVAGSLLGIFLHKKISFPVGKVDYLRLEPMDFEEYLWATGNLSVRFSLQDLQEKDGLLNIPLYLSYLFDDLTDIHLKEKEAK